MTSKLCKRCGEDKDISLFSTSGTSDNVQVVCWWYNFAKSTFSDQEVLELCKKLVNHASLST